MDRDEIEVNKIAKKIEVNVLHLHRTSVVNKGFTTWPKRELFLVAGPTREIRSGQVG